MRGLYIHVPFCLSKCPYCDFYSVPFEESLSERYVRAVIRNIRVYGGEFDSVYFGGGTPILIAEDIGEILRAAQIAGGAEITVECNPCRMTEGALEALLKAGVNRLSVGVQSLNDEELGALGRRHDARTAERAIIAAKRAGFENISADIMLATPRQTAESLTDTVARLAELPLTHVSAYMLKIEPDTPYGRNPPALPDDDETADIYLSAVSALERRGFAQYEISNFAREGFGCAHNLKYWRREEYLGIGAAAHSLYKGRRFYVGRDAAAFAEAERQREIAEGDIPNEREVYEEKVMLGLRLSEGIAEELYGPLLSGLKYVPERYYTLKNGRLSLTAEGFAVSNTIIAALLADRGDQRSAGAL